MTENSPTSHNDGVAAKTPDRRGTAPRESLRDFGAILIGWSKQS